MFAVERTLCPDYIGHDLKQISQGFFGNFPYAIDHKNVKKATNCRLESIGFNKWCLVEFFWLLFSGLSMASDEFFNSLILDENVDYLVERKLENNGFGYVRFIEGAGDSDLMAFCMDKELPLLTEDDDFKTDIIAMSHFGILFDRYLSRRDTDMVTDTIGDVLSTYDKETLSNEIWHLSDFYGRNNF